MAKKKQQQNVQLTPENYIRKVSSKLPIYKCWINEKWEDKKLCNVLIARKHANGNITLCIYLVDLACLGVKDTLFRFNLDLDDFEEFLDGLSDSQDLIEIDYMLAHNIVHAGIEFADDYGFKPHKDFSTTTKYFLEGDTDDIPLMEINCGGEDGLPLYINSGFETKVQENQIMTTLEKTAGPGNYNYIVPGNENRLFFDDDEVDDEFDDEITYEDFKEIYKLKDTNTIYIEWETLYSDLTKDDDFHEDNLTKLHAITDLLAERLNLLDTVKIKNSLIDINNDLLVYTINETELPNSLFGNMYVEDTDFLCDDFFDIVDSEKKKKFIKKFENKYGKIPAVEYFKLVGLIVEDKSQKAKKQLNNLLDEYPDYFLFKLLSLEQILLENRTEEVAIDRLNKLLKEKTITHFEYQKYVIDYGTYILKITESETEIEKLVALYVFMNSLEDCKVDFLFFSILQLMYILRVGDLIPAKMNAVN